MLIDDRTTHFDAGHGIIIQTPPPYMYEVIGTAPHMLIWCESEPLSGPALPGIAPRLFPISPMMKTLVELGLVAERRLQPVRDALAFHLGFQNAAHFSRRMKQVTGMTPIGVREWAVSASLAERADFFRTIEKANPIA